LSWGDSFPAELRSSIQSGVDFLIIFLDNEALRSEWVKQELEWAIEREKQLKRTFVLPILLEEVAPETCQPDSLSDFHSAERFHSGIGRVIGAQGHTTALPISGRKFLRSTAEIPPRESLRTARDQLSAG
jgi:hypothetical protein